MYETTVVITTRNEVGSIGALCRRLRTDGYGVVVVDDCSKDSTTVAAAQAGAIVERTEKRLGIGPCLVLGWQAALMADSKYIIQMDAGHSHDPSTIPVLLGPLIAKEADLVIGSRFLSSSAYIGRPWRAHASKLIARICNDIYRTTLTDWTSGYRAFTRDVLSYLIECSYMSKMHSFQIEVLSNALYHGARIKDVPITYVAGRSAVNMGIMLEAAKLLVTIGVIEAFEDHRMVHI